MANNTGLIIGVSVVGVAAIGVTIYLLSKKSSKETNTSTGYPPMGTGGFVPPSQRPQNPPIGYYANPAPADKDSWWQNPLGQVGGNFANRLVDSLFKPRSGSGSSTVDTGDDDSASLYRGDTDPNFYAGYGEV